MREKKERGTGRKVKVARKFWRQLAPTRGCRLVSAGGAGVLGCWGRCLGWGFGGFGLAGCWLLAAGVAGCWLAVAGPERT